MVQTKNLINESAVVKMRELAGKAKLGFFQTNIGKSVGNGRPMAIAEIDNEGTLWFFSNASSNKNAEIKADSQVQVIFSNPDSAEFMVITGEAEIVFNKHKIDELWHADLRSWFPKGKNDDDISLITVKPKEGHYWDMKQNKAIAFIKGKLGALVGMQVDNVVEGALRP
jgi:general stress protein 26